MTEKISKLIDQDLSPDQRKELFERLTNSEAEGSDEERKSWKNVHLIGDVIRGDVSSTDRDLSGLIRDRLAKEPTVFAPSNIKESVADEVKVEGKTGWRSVGLFTIATSLVVIAVVFTLTQFDNGGPLTASGKAVNENQTVSVSRVIPFPQDFDEMLVNHAEFTSSPAMNGLVSYSKLISADRGQK